MSNIDAWTLDAWTWDANSKEVKNSEANQCALMEHLICECLYYYNRNRYWHTPWYLNKLIGMIEMYHTNKNVFNKKNVFELKYISSSQLQHEFPFGSKFYNYFTQYIQPLFDMYNSDRVEFVMFSHISRDCGADNKIAYFLSGKSLAKQVWKKHITSFLQVPYEQFLEEL
jgi:hypothetical protein